MKCNNSLGNAMSVSIPLECGLYANLTGVGPYFGLYVIQEFIFVSDWGEGSLTVFDSHGSYKQELVSGLSRPTQFFIFHPTNIIGKISAFNELVCTCK